MFFVFRVVFFVFKSTHKSRNTFTANYFLHVPNAKPSPCCVSFLLFLAACGDGLRENKADQNLDALFRNCWETRLQLFPLEATANGDNRYNDRFTINIAGSFRDSLRRFYQSYADSAAAADTTGLDDSHALSLRLFRYEMRMNLEGLTYPTHLTPINQFWSPTLDLPLLGSGQGNQPFKTAADYDAFLKRMSYFPAWADTAIANMREGMATGYVLPAVLVRKVLPQLAAIYDGPADSSIFLRPLTTFPKEISENDRIRLGEAYRNMVATIVNPNYRKLHDFMQTEYLPKARETAGVSALPNGAAYYNYCIRFWTTTENSADSIFHRGELEVARITDEMNAVKRETGYESSLQEFFEYLNTDPKFYPFTTAAQVLDSFRAIHKDEEPGLKNLFDRTPKSAFTIRQTEAFREASASAEYNPASGDGSRPGIFYVPVPDAKKFNAVGMETLFLHEAIPGHHYQISLQQEDKNLPQFRRFSWYGAYGEGWALYSESLGKELGVYKNPYQYFGHLSDAMHRAIRLVVDVGLHAKGWTREEAIAYMTAHERTSDAEATAEIERYMALPGQALSYKTGELKIRALRTRYEKELGPQFRIQSFHDQVLGYGCLPLSILVEKLEQWSKKILEQQKQQAATSK